MISCAVVARHGARRPLRPVRDEAIDRRALFGIARPRLLREWARHATVKCLLEHRATAGLLARVARLRAVRPE